MNYLHSDKIKELKSRSNEIRKSIIEDILEDGSEHTSKYLRGVDILTLLYFHILKHDPKDPNRKDRDRLIFSNRNIYPAFYATLSHAGYFPTEELKIFCKTTCREFLPNIETSSGSLGSLSQAVGITLADRMDRGSSDRFFYYFSDDKELQEERNWETIHLAGKKQLHNLITIIDGKNIQIDGFKRNTMLLESFADKFEKFNWHVLSANSHDFDDMDDAIGQAQAVFAKPTVIIVQ